MPLFGDKTETYNQVSEIKKRIWKIGLKIACIPLVKQAKGDNDIFCQEIAEFLSQCSKILQTKYHGGGTPDYKSKDLEEIIVDFISIGLAEMNDEHLVSIGNNFIKKICLVYN